MGSPIPRGWLAAAALISTVGAAAGQPVDFDVVYVRQPRYGDDVGTIWPEIFHPARAEPGADLMLLRNQEPPGP